MATTQSPERSHHKLSAGLLINFDWTELVNYCKWPNLVRNNSSDSSAAVYRLDKSYDDQRRWTLGTGGENCSCWSW